MRLLRVAGPGRAGLGPGRALVLAILLALAGPPRALGSALSEGAHAVPALELVLAEPGPALRSALAAMNEGERLLADALLAAIAGRHAVIADYADLLRMRLRVDARRFDDAIALGESGAPPDSPVRAEFFTLLGLAYTAEGREERARAAWEIARRASRDRERLVALHLSIAASYQRSGDLDRAVDELLAVWTRYPDQPEAETAEADLVEIEQRQHRRLRTASDYRQRAQALYRRRHNEEALAAYDQALALGLRRAETERARHDRAETLFRLRRYPEAAEAFGALPATEARRIQRARAHARSGQVQRGAKELEALGRKSKTGQGKRALLLAALLYDGEGDSERARRLYRAILSRAPSSSYAASARWRLAWDSYRRGRYLEAIAFFDEIERRDEDPVSRLRPRYWRIRAAEAGGDAEATARYTALAREFPLSYYGWRARGRASATDTVRVPPELVRGRAALSPSELARPSILLEAGLVDEARAELDRLVERAVGVDDRLALAGLYANAGDFHRPQRLMVDAYTERLARGPDPDHLELWWHAWPAPFEDEMRGATLDGLKVDPELVYSIMREESGYRPKIVSVSGARGLLQLMPTTAERVARSVQLDHFTADDLFVPRVNIQLGADYLSGLVRQFEGQTSAAIGSYNAGPQAVARWVSDDREDDVWVEEIPYGQTRGYVKRVLRSLHAYRVLY